MASSPEYPAFIHLPFYQQRRVSGKRHLEEETRDDHGHKHGLQKKKTRAKRRQHENDLLQSIHESLRESASDSESIAGNSISFGGTAVPLPGHDEKLSCKLCRLRVTPGTLDQKSSREGASLSDLLQVGHTRFDQEEGRPPMDIAKEIRECLVQFNEKCGISLLNDLTDDEVFRHFKFDHMRKQKPKLKDKMLRALDSMLQVSLQSCCEQGGPGTLFLNKSDIPLTLSIMDRVNKVITLKESD
jgi:hypothetical protein